jgi:hypothetical protein
MLFDDCRARILPHSSSVCTLNSSQLQGVDRTPRGSRIDSLRLMALPSWPTDARSAPPPSPSPSASQRTSPTRRTTSPAPFLRPLHFLLTPGAHAPTTKPLRPRQAEPSTHHRCRWRGSPLLSPLNSEQQGMEMPSPPLPVASGRSPLRGPGVRPTRDDGQQGRGRNPLDVGTSEPQPPRAPSRYRASFGPLLLRRRSRSTRAGAPRGPRECPVIRRPIQTAPSPPLRDPG